MKSDINESAKAMLVGGRYQSVDTIDPGLGGTGLAHWSFLSHAFPNALPPIWTSVVHKPKPSMGCVGWQAETNYIAMNVVSRSHKPRHIFIEIPRLWARDKASRASASRGDLTKLSVLVGAIMNEYYRRYPRVQVYTAFPADWKGQLPKEVVLDRIEAALGRRYRDHEADAVGMGLAIQGVL